MYKNVLLLVLLMCSLTFASIVPTFDEDSFIWEIKTEEIINVETPFSLGLRNTSGEFEYFSMLFVTIQGSINFDIDDMFLPQDGSIQLYKDKGRLGISGFAYDYSMGRSRRPPPEGSTLGNFFSGVIVEGEGIIAVFDGYNNDGFYLGSINCVPHTPEPTTILLLSFGTVLFLGKKNNGC